MNNNIFIIVLILVLTIIFRMLYFIMKNQNYYHYETVFKFKLLIWYYIKLGEKDRKLSLKIRKYVENKTFQNFINDNNNNKIVPYVSGFFNKSYILNYYDNQYINPDIYGKKNSLTDLLTELIVPKSILGEWYGNSVFLKNYKDRGVDNEIKKKYMFALQEKYLINYKNIINTYLNKINNYNGSLYNFVENICIDLTYIIHFNKKPSNIDKYYMKLFIKAFSTFYILKKRDIYTKYIYESKYFIEILENNIDNIKEDEYSIIGIWLKYNKINKKTSLTEFLHNIVGMTLNWILLLYNFTKEYKVNIPSEKTDKKYLHECMRYICPIKIINSKLEDNKHFKLNKNLNCNVSHNLDFICKSKKYFKYNKTFNKNNFNDNDFTYSKSNNLYSNSSKFKNYNAVILKDQFLCEKKGYVPFGEGYRRCPGEHLSYSILEIYKDFITNKKYKLYKTNEKVNNINAGIDNLDYNLYINIK